MSKTFHHAACAALTFAAMAAAAPAHAQGDEPFLGQMVWVSFGFCPKGWAQADGQLLPIAQNQALFSLFGTQFGGDGRTTFALPDVRGRTLVGQGQGQGLPPVSIGEVGGAATRTMTTANLPPHAHLATATMTLGATDSGGLALAPAGDVLAGARTTQVYAASAATVDMDSSAVASVAAVVQPAGGAQPFSTLQPYETLLACVALRGVFPSRN